MNGKHWSDEQLIEHLYGVGPLDEHLSSCTKCQARLEGMQLSRRAVESSYSEAEAVSQEALAAQRRAIYARIEAERARPWWIVPGRAWASAALALALLGGSWVVHNDPYLFGSRRPSQVERQPKISDAELADQVSQIADDAEPQPAAPLKALFED